MEVNCIIEVTLEDVVVFVELLGVGNVKDGRGDPFACETRNYARYILIFDDFVLGMVLQELAFFLSFRNLQNFAIHFLPVFESFHFCLMPR